MKIRKRFQNKQCNVKNDMIILPHEDNVWINTNRFIGDFFKDNISTFNVLIH